MGTGDTHYLQAADLQLKSQSWGQITRQNTTTNHLQSSPLRVPFHIHTQPEEGGVVVRALVVLGPGDRSSLPESSAGAQGATG
ncbi:unnamed protein product [Lota lota]